MTMNESQVCEGPAKNLAVIAKRVQKVARRLVLHTERERERERERAREREREKERERARERAREQERERERERERVHFLSCQNTF